MSDESKQGTPDLVSACRTTIGDRLRSVTYFSSREVEQLYLRDDLASDADLIGFVEAERRGFHTQTLYGDTELGSYEYTIRAFEYGYLTRVIVGDEGVFVTTDELSVDRFRDLAATLESALAEY